MRLFASFFLGVLLPLTVAGAALAQSAGKDVHVLFIGNSFTAANDLPHMVAELARAGKQKPFKYEKDVPGGYTLTRHWNDGKSLAKIKSRKWDFVVLQEQSQTPLFARDSMFVSAHKFDEEIRKQGAKTVLYMTWAQLDRPDDQAGLTGAYTDLARDLKCTLAPVGNAWKASLAANPKLRLHDKDNRHPTLRGTYLAACVFYATIYDKSPEGLPGHFAKLNDNDSKALQTVAWKTVQFGR